MTHLARRNLGGGRIRGVSGGYGARSRGEVPEVNEPDGTTW